VDEHPSAADGRYARLVTVRFAAWVTVLMCSCGAFRHPTGPSEEPLIRNDKLLDRNLPRLIVEIDHLSGIEPRPGALALLGERLALYVDKPGGIEIIVDDVIPAEAWDGDRRTFGKLARRYANPPSDGSGYVYVLYLSSYKRFRGLSFQPGSLRPKIDYPMAGMFMDKIHPMLWVTGVRQEGAVLVHEFGHLMGLVTEPAHYVDGHCTNSWCLMYDGLDTRSVLLHALPTLLAGYLPTRYCGDCCRDLWLDAPLPGHRPERRPVVLIRYADDRMDP